MSRYFEAVLTFATLVIIVGLCGCGGGGGAPPPPAGTASIQGVVVAGNDTGSVIVGSEVTVEPPGVTTTTNTLGQFLLASLPGGNLTLTATAPLDPNYQPASLIVPTTPGQTTTVNVALLPTSAGDPVLVTIDPMNPVIEVFGQVTFRSQVVNASGLVAVEPTWMVNGDIGAIGLDGTFTALNPGTGSIVAVAGSVSTSTSAVVTGPRPPDMSTIIVSPAALPASGGDVQITATISDGQGVDSVTAEVYEPDGGLWTSAMPLVVGTIYNGTYRITYSAPANSNVPDPSGTQAPQTYSVRIVARDAASLVSNSAFHDFVVEGLLAPPPPPPPGL